MKELEYPFDVEYVMKKRKSIKRTLLTDGSSRLKKKIAVFGGSTTNDIVVYLDLFLLNNGIEAEFYQSEYAQYWQDARIMQSGESCTIRLKRILKEPMKKRTFLHGSDILPLSAWRKKQRTTPRQNLYSSARMKQCTGIKRSLRKRTA